MPAMTITRPIQHLLGASHPPSGSLLLLPAATCTGVSAPFVACTAAGAGVPAVNIPMDNAADVGSPSLPDAAGLDQEGGTLTALEGTAATGSRPPTLP